MSLAEISSWLEKAYTHGTKGITPLLKALGNSFDYQASPPKPSQKCLGLFARIPPTMLTSTASKQLFKAYQTSA